MGYIISDTHRNLARLRGRLRRTGKPIVHYFHQADDPYSHMAAQKLDLLRQRYDVDFETHQVSSPDKEFQGDASRFKEWALTDARSVAAFYGTELPDKLEKPSTDTTEGDLLRRRLGHYLSATFFFEGEWYWGLDRLHHLEHRLIELGFSQEPGEICVPRPRPEAATGIDASGITLEYFPSLRSPYTAISFDRTIDLARRSGVTLRLRPVMPMMMRGIPAPRTKQLYIMTDAKREADYYHVEFGPIVDPIGEPVKRAFALLPYMQSQGKEVEYCSNYLKAAWAEGLDITTEDGLREVVERSGASWEAATALGSSWQPLLDDNVNDMLEAGLWGVPSFRVSGGNNDQPFSCWGQDRLWRVETEISRRCA
ncbi:MAG: hypothetical protein HOC70_16625 [Gammaproteobacteria bacterium]|nr:hypothetical protein [Gammaproteobacteria bacterium]MBT4494872.1 hypothetical protein [Gammaproteobacteria bacterium]